MTNFFVSNFSYEKNWNATTQSANRCKSFSFSPTKFVISEFKIDYEKKSKKNEGGRSPPQITFSDQMALQALHSHNFTCSVEPT